jgi:hypothetical protein
MVRIIIKEQSFDIKRIVSFGCSYTAGTEILDYQLSPYFVDLKNKLDVYQWWEKLKENPEQMKLQLELRKKELNHAWPAHLASHLGVDFINYAEPGNSNENMHWQIEQKLESGEITNDDLILVGLSNADRSMFFSSGHPHPLPFLLSAADSYTKHLPEKILQWFSDDRIIWDHYRNLKSFESVKQKLHGKLFVVPMREVRKEVCPWPSTYDYGTYRVVSRENALFFNKVINQLQNSQLFITTDCCLSDFKTRLPHGHPNEDAHRAFAERIYKENVTLE